VSEQFDAYELANWLIGNAVRAHGRCAIVVSNKRGLYRIKELRMDTDSDDNPVVLVVADELAEEDTDWK